MKKKLLIFNILLLSFVSVFAQKMDKITFEKLVDYANCQYLMAFIEKNDVGKPYIFNTYEKSIKPVLSKATLNDLKKVPDYFEIKNLFANGSNNLALQLAEKINDRKSKYDNHFDNHSLIESLISTNWNSVDLAVINTNIQSSIKKKFNAYPSQVTNTATVQPIQTPPQVERPQPQVNSSPKKNTPAQDKTEIVSLQKQISTLRILLIICLIGVVINSAVLFKLYKSKPKVEDNAVSNFKLFILKIFKKKETKKNKDGEKSKEKYGKKQKESNQVKKGYNSVNDNKNNSNQNGDTKENTGQPNQVVVQPVIPTQPTYNPQPTFNSHPSNQTIPKEVVLYFEDKFDNKLISQQPNSANAKFRVFSINGNEANFEYIGPAKNPNWFGNVCDVSNPNETTKYKSLTIELGKVHKENDNWVVIKPAKIKFI